MNNLLRSSKMFLKKNASTILTITGGVGVIATSVLAVKATPKAMRLLDEAKEEKQEELTRFETVIVAGPAYIPAAITGAATIACIFGANVLHQRQQAALMSAYALLDNSYKEYREKVNELYGEDADNTVKTAIAKDKYESGEYPLEGDKRLYFDDYSGRYYEATSADILRAENFLNRKMAESYGLFLNEYYEQIGLEPTDYGNYMGWSSVEMYETTWESWFRFYHEKVVMDDGLECTIVRFGMDPTFDFYNYY